MKVDYSFFVVSSRLLDDVSIHDVSTHDDWQEIIKTTMLLSLRLAELMLNAPTNIPEEYKKVLAAEYFSTSQQVLFQSLNNDKNGSLIVLVINNKAVGYALILHQVESRNDDEISLLYLAIEPEYQGRGFTKILLDKCVQEFNAKFILINTDKKLRSFYEEKLNFQYVNKCSDDPLDINMVYSVDGINDKDHFIKMTKLKFKTNQFTDFKVLVDHHSKQKEMYLKDGKRGNEPIEIKSNLFKF